MAECLRQIVPNRWASVRKRSFTKCFCVYMRGDKGSCVERELVTQGGTDTEIRFSTES